MVRQTCRLVPDVVGMTLKEAEVLLQRAGFGKIQTTVTKPPGNGRVSGECRVVQQKLMIDHRVSLVVAYPYFHKDAAEGGCT